MKLRKPAFIVCFVLVICLFVFKPVFSGQECIPNTCPSGKYPVSNIVSRGIQTISGINFLSAQIAEKAIKKELLKTLNGAGIKIRLKTYSAGDLIAGKIKGFEATGKNITFEDVYISNIKIQSMCDFTSFDYKSRPAMLKTPLYIKYNGEITNEGLEKIFSSDAIKKAFRGIKIMLNNLVIGKVDLTEVQPSLENDKLNFKANLAFRNSFFKVKFPVSFTAKPEVKDNKLSINFLSFAKDLMSKQFGFITDSLKLNNINILNFKNLGKKDSKLNINKIQINDKIFIEGTFWQPGNTTF